MYGKYNVRLSSLIRKVYHNIQIRVKFVRIEELTFTQAGIRLRIKREQCVKIRDKAIIKASQITAANQFPLSENAGQRQMPQGCYCLDTPQNLYNQ